MSDAKLVEVERALKEAYDEWRNAERIRAAAPDLLAALKEADRLYSSCGLQAEHRDCGPWINSVREAIAKAEGRS
jgi:hypothetical protein